MMVQDEESGKRRDDNGRQEDGRRGEWREEVEGRGTAEWASSAI